MFNNRLKEYRVLRGLSQTQLANKIGVSRSLVSMYESGERKPSFEVLESIADILNVSFNDLMGVDESHYIQMQNNDSPLGLDPDVQELATQIQKLDAEDRAEIRGEVRGMLRADKYKQDAADTA